MIERLKQFAVRLKRDIHTLYFAAQDSRTPWYAKLVVLIVIAYAFSPVDLIPDFIPVIGLLDELILLPLGIALAIRLLPEAVLSECRARQMAKSERGKVLGYIAAACVIFLWLAVVYWLVGRFW